MSKKPGNDESATKGKERKIVITMRSERSRRSFQVVVDDHFTFGLSTSPAFGLLLFLMCAAIAWGYWQL